MYVSLRLSVRTLLLRAEQAGTGVKALSISHMRGCLHQYVFNEEFDIGQ